MERKALLLSLQALAKLSFPFSMTILGDGPQGHLIKAWIEELGLVDNVQWKGRVPWHEVQAAFKEHQVFLFTSLRDSFGSQIVEAMSHGLAIVTLDHQGAHDFVPDAAGIRVPVTKPDQSIGALGEALTMIHENPMQFHKMSKAGLEFARLNAWSLKARSITEIYLRIIEGHPQEVTR